MDKNLLKLVLAALVIIIIFRMLSSRRQNYAELDAEYYGEDPMEADYETVPPGTTRPIVTGAPQVSLPPMATSVDLLPKPQVSPAPGDFAEFAPKPLQGQNFISGTQFVGIESDLFRKPLDC